eukprot:TRINITY_DN41320_c0_g1_i1.p1 TRINITY_DN41320_c0_g1~~TRINITY_DN41320_c0_g1_i1.p1  ORF type:complete len:280 (+),score=57.19 TRINITY_DN41320_c0_g1_i1:34-873(+)
MLRDGWPRRRHRHLLCTALLAVFCLVQQLSQLNGAGAFSGVFAEQKHSLQRSLCSRTAFSLTTEEEAMIRAWETQEEVLGDASASAKIAEAGFPIEPDELILRAKLYLAKNQYSIEDPSMLAENFTFCGPVVGPMDKATFKKVLGAFDLAKAFPNNRVRWHHFRVDPFDPSRVLFTGRPTGTNTGPIPSYVPEPEGTGKTYEGAPEAASLKFLRDGTIVEYTAAYVMDKNQGNTGGMTGVAGLLYGIGRDLAFGTGLIPEARPYQPSPLWALLKSFGLA